MKISNVALLGAILLLSTADAKKKDKKNNNGKKNSGKKKTVKTPATAPASKSNKKPNGDISDLFRSNRKNTNNRKKKKGGNNKKKKGGTTQKKKLGNTAQRAVDDDLLLAVQTDIPTYIPTVRHISYGSGGVSLYAIVYNLYLILVYRTNFPCNSISVHAYLHPNG